MSTYAIIFWTVVATLAVVWLLRQFADKEGSQPTEWERYEHQRQVLDAEVRARDKARQREVQDQARMKVVAARVTTPRTATALVTTEDGVEHSVPYPPDVPFVEQELIGDTLEEARQRYGEA